MDESEEQPPLKRPCLEFQRADNVDIAEEIKIPCSPGMAATISLPTTFPNSSSTQIKNTAAAAAASSLGITSATSPPSSSSVPIPATSIVLVPTVSSALIPATSSAFTTDSSLASLTANTDSKVQHLPTSAASPQTEEPKLPSIAPKNDTVLIESSIDLPISVHPPSGPESSCTIKISLLSDPQAQLPETTPNSADTIKSSSLPPPSDKSEVVADQAKQTTMSSDDLPSKQPASGLKPRDSILSLSEAATVLTTPLDGPNMVKANVLGEETKVTLFSSDGSAEAGKFPISEVKSHSVRPSTSVSSTDALILASCTSSLVLNSTQSSATAVITSTASSKVSDCLAIEKIPPVSSSSSVSILEKTSVVSSDSNEIQGLALEITSVPMKTLTMPSSSTKMPSKSDLIEPSLDSDFASAANPLCADLPCVKVQDSSQISSTASLLTQPDSSNLKYSSHPPSLVSSTDKNPKEKDPDVSGSHANIQEEANSTHSKILIPLDSSTGEKPSCTVSSPVITSVNSIVSIELATFSKSNKASDIPIKVSKSITKLQHVDEKAQERPNKLECNIAKRVDPSDDIQCDSKVQDNAESHLLISESILSTGGISSNCSNENVEHLKPNENSIGSSERVNTEDITIEKLDETTFVDKSAEGSDILKSIISVFGITASENLSDETIMGTDTVTSNESTSGESSKRLGTATDPSESLVDSAVPKIVLDEEEAMDIDDSIVTNIRDVQKGSLDKSVADASLFLDDESCDTVMRKPEPVSNIREETLAGDPRLEALDIGITESASMDDADDSSVDASKVTINNLESSVDQSIAAEEGNEEQEDDDDTSKKSVKKRKKPRRSIFYKPRPERKRKEKEQEENTTTGLAGEQASVGSPVTNLDEDSQGSSGAKKEKEVRRFRYEVVVPESTEAFTVDKVMEYVWPLEGGYGEHYFVQEHISQYIGISSFKRKYPDLRRRPIDVSERDYLKELGVVSEIACDMGLTAVRSEDVMDILFADFPAKFEELSKHLSERRDNQLKQQGKVDYQLANIDKSKLHEYARQAAEEAALWNAALCREKREERRYSFDLQTFTLQQPLGVRKKLPPSATRVGHYPVAVLPGQYTDYCKRYTSEELKKLPLNSVCVGPLYEDLPQEEADQLGASADADHDGQIKSELPEEKGLLCKVCFFGKERNKAGKPEGLIVCAKCSSASHASCVDLNPSMIPRINSYSWQCMECKHCMQCKTAEDEDKMIFCDLCDRGYHIYCVGLRRVPQGRWHCKECAMCNSCGARTPAGGEVIKNAEWQHEFRKRKDNKIGYATTLCVPCDRLWKRRQYCYVCLKVYKSIVEDSMVRCANCPKYIHREKHECSAMFEGEFLCLPCFKSSKTTILNHNRIIAAAKRKMASGF